MEFARFARRNLHAQPRKKFETSNLPIKTKIFSKKSMVSTLKVERSQKFVWGLPDEIGRLNPKC
jgi:hypothetical protein